LVWAWQVFAEGLQSNVLTVHEMLHDAEYASAPFYKLDPATFDRAVQVLERQGKAQRFSNPGEGGEGIKFY
jgi:chitinase